MLWIDIGTYPANFRRYFQFSGLISSYQFNIRGTDNHGINDPSGTVVFNANPLAYAAVVQRLNDGPNLDAALIAVRVSDRPRSTIVFARKTFSQSTVPEAKVIFAS